MCSRTHSWSRVVPLRLGIADPEALRLNGSLRPARHLPVLIPGTWGRATHSRRELSLTNFHRLWKLFDDVDTDQSDDIDATELRKHSVLFCVPAIPLILPSPREGAN